MALRHVCIVVGSLHLFGCAVPAESSNVPHRRAFDSPLASALEAAPEPLAARTPPPLSAGVADGGLLLQNPRSSAPRPPSSSERWRRGATALQGYVGAAFYEMSREDGLDSNLDDEDATFPTIGGGAQWKLAGERVDFGVEGLLSFAWQGNLSALAVGSGGAVVAVDVDLLVIDLYGGPFVNVFLGKNTRVYGGAGPLLQWGNYDQDGPSSGTSGSGDGFGVGYYLRTGIEFGMSPHTMLGFGVRWTDATMDLSGGLGDLDLSGLQAVLTVTQGF